MRRLSTSKMSALLPIISRFNTISIKIPVSFFFFLEIDKSFLKFLSKFKVPKKATKALQLKNVGGFTLTFRLLIKLL